MKRENKIKSTINDLDITSISNFIHSSEVMTTWQTDSAAHKLKPRSFHKFMSPNTEFTYSKHLWANPIDFYLLVWTMSDNSISYDPYFYLLFTCFFTSFYALFKCYLPEVQYEVLIQH